MRIDQEKCSGCGICIPYCPANAITIVNKKAQIDEDECFECGNCSRIRVVRCPKKAFFEQPGLYEGTRAARKFFSDPMTTHSVTKIPGRGTEEVKTNDVTGRVVRGQIGIAIEMGRPCLGTNMEQVEQMTVALGKLGIEFEEMNPLTHLMEDREKGTIKPEYMNEKMVSAIIEFGIPVSQMVPVMDVIKEVAKELDTVFSLDMIYRFEEDGSLPIVPVLEEMGIRVRKNSKVNLGLGRPVVTR
ncbi:MAG: (4Fe-4S)-binding protein [Peptococcaceae bacterium BICA1-8]|nr:MAG: (4Fe-4S)-binding protein [Peptococcaceae bacterium BICA1-8]